MDRSVALAQAAQNTEEALELLRKAAEQVGAGGEISVEIFTVYLSDCGHGERERAGAGATHVGKRRRGAEFLRHVLGRIWSRGTRIWASWRSTCRASPFPPNSYGERIVQWSVLMDGLTPWNYFPNPHPNQFPDF
jgi:hypothetical protein